LKRVQLYRLRLGTVLVSEGWEAVLTAC
jgi:hypothetical protein